MSRLYLKTGRERPVLNGHPWIFSGAIEKEESDGGAPGIADVYDARGSWIARGLYNPLSQIRLRVLTCKDEPIDDDFFHRRIGQALALRRHCLGDSATAYRVIHGEGDFLPGLVVDRYADYLVCQFMAAGLEAYKSSIADLVMSACSAKGVFEKSEGRVREEEGLPASIGTLAGSAPPDLLEIYENGLKFVVNIRRGQKTGFFLDQRDNRVFLRSLVRDGSVLNCFSYSGAFTVYALAGGARSVVSLDSSRPALELAEKNLALNGFDAENADLIKGDAFTYLKESEDDFDVIVLDPPSLARRRSDLEAAAGGYKFLNLHALKHVHSGGLLLTFSCSQHVSIDLFQKIVFGAAADAKRRVAWLKRLGAALDHPVSLHHPEGEYLKGLALRVLD
jgi:23S rRNA (cytosine1962-C5)-methyltransferase